MLSNQFWALNRERSFSANEGMLYFALLDISNSLGWKNPFNQSNRNLCTQCNFSEKTLIKARNYLKQSDLIDFKSDVGRRNNTVYEIKYCKIYSISNSISDSISGSISDSILGKNSPDNTKHKLNKTKLNNEKEIIKEKNIIPPTLEMVAQYCNERNNFVNPEKFIAFYESNGWKVGKNKMKNWQAAVITWEGNNFSKQRKISTTETNAMSVLAVLKEIENENNQNYEQYSVI